MHFFYFSDLARDLPVKVDATTFDSPHTKSLLLLYAHLCRTPMPSTDYVTDLKSVLDQAIRVLQVDFSKVDCTVSVYGTGSDVVAVF